MAWYFWRGKYQNRVHSGITKAFNEKYLKDYLMAADITLLEHRLATTKIKLSSMQRLEFYQNLLALLKSGLPLLDSLVILQKGAKRKNYAVFLHAFITDLEFGLQELSIEDIFPDQEAIFIKIGLENNLINFLTKLVQEMQLAIQFKKKFFKILFMPILSFASLFGVFIFMVFYVIPEISDLTGVQPVFFDYFSGLTNFELIITSLIIVVLLSFIFRQIFIFAKILLFKELQILPGLRIFSCLLQAGLTNSQAFFALTSLENFKEWDVLFDLQKKGLSFTESLKAANWHKLVPELCSLIEISSFENNLAENMEQLVGYYNQKIIDKLEIIVTALQPFIILIIALSVFMLISKIYLPLIDINNLNI
jgi:type II secretory pathway component PulF